MVIMEYFFRFIAFNVMLRASNSEYSQTTYEIIEHSLNDSRHSAMTYLVHTIPNSCLTCCASKCSKAELCVYFFYHLDSNICSLYSRVFQLSSQYNIERNGLCYVRKGNADFFRISKCDAWPNTLLHATAYKMCFKHMEIFSSKTKVTNLTKRQRKGDCT